MSNIRSFKQKLARVYRLWQAKQYDQALGIVAALAEAWPGNPQLRLLWASLAQLQDKPSHTLAEVKQALLEAIVLDKDGPAPAIELGHYLDAVEDDPHAAAKAFAEGTRNARRLLIDGLLGQAKALLQVNKRQEAWRCLKECLYLVLVDAPFQSDQWADARLDFVWHDPSWPILLSQVKDPLAGEIEVLLKDFFANRSA